MKAPCKDCAERHEGCHGECEKYKAFRESIDRRTEETTKRKAAAPQLSRKVVRQIWKEMKGR